jgi:hypothetical protein
LTWQYPGDAFHPQHAPEPTNTSAVAGSQKKGELQYKTLPSTYSLE